MIQLTRLDLQHITVNADEIETVESTHDTMICLRSGKRIIVQESAEEIIQRVIEYRRLCALPPEGQVPGV